MSDDVRAAQSPEAVMRGPMKPILLGMNNPLAGGEEFALYPDPPGCAGHNLWRMSGLSKEEYLELFERRNMMEGRVWLPPVAAEAAAKLREELAGRTVVLLGNDVASLMWHDAPHWVWRQHDGGGWWVRIPHPSGRCRHWNDPMVRAAGEVFMQELAHSAREGSVPAEHALGDA